METIKPHSHYVFKLVLVFIFIMILVGAFRHGPSGWNGSSKNGVMDTPAITVTGSGEVFASPDIATVTFEVRKEAKTTTDAGAQVNTIISDMKNGLIAKGVAEKDIKTQYYTTQPVYDYVTNNVACTANYCPPSGKQVLRGYEVSQGIEVKIRKIDTSGDIVTFLGTKGVTNMSGLVFSIDNKDALVAQARQQAIDEAKANAQTLAKQLGVRLVRIINFTEDNNPVYPIYARGGAMDLKAESVAPAPAVLPTGEDKVTSNVTIVYEIR